MLGGDGWVECDFGHQHWGIHGAAGLLVYRRDTRSGQATDVLLQHRAEWSHHGGTWGLLGGARQRGEPVVDTARREAGEEAVIAGEITVDGLHEDDHGSWVYSTLIAEASEGLSAAAAGAESLDVRWWPIDELVASAMHPGLSASWPVLRPSLTPWHVVIDAANVIGSRPDGWWRDRAGAAARLIDRCASLSRTGLARELLHEVRPAELLHHRWPRWTVVVEGAARSVAAAAYARSAGVHVLAAAGSGDDAIVAEVKRLPDVDMLVVTADRELRQRCNEAGATTIGPRWLLDRLPVTGEKPDSPAAATE